MITLDKYIKERNKDPEYREFFEEEKKMAELAVKVAKARIELGLSQKQLADLAGLTQQQVSKVESAKNSNMRTFLKVTGALKLHLSLS